MAQIKRASRKAQFSIPFKAQSRLQPHPPEQMWGGGSEAGGWAIAHAGHCKPKELVALGCIHRRESYRGSYVDAVKAIIGM